MKDEEKLVSIITTIFNTEKYLNDYFESIVNQTYKNWELIVVDDGSSDSSGKIIEEWRKKDKRIHSFYQENQGISVARNLALDNCCGEIITFVDSDDFISQFFLEKLISELEKESADIVTSNFFILYKDACILSNKMLQMKTIMTSEDYLRLFYKYPGCYAMVYKSIYKREIFNNIRFRAGVLNEDSDITYYIYCKPLRIIYIPEPLYYYRKRRSSIMGTKDERLALSESLWIKRHIEKYKETGKTELFFLAMKLYIYTLAEDYLYLSISNRKLAKVEMKNRIKILIKSSYFPPLIVLKMIFMYLFTEQYSLWIIKKNKQKYQKWE